uniref:SHSP domain-containing protein n=2 Tax=Strigops habroptila TaxID=2489341 RepID=A0A672UTA5_STRHB
MSVVAGRRPPHRGRGLGGHRQQAPWPRSAQPPRIALSSSAPTARAMANPTSRATGGTGPSEHWHTRPLGSQVPGVGGGRESLASLGGLPQGYPLPCAGHTWDPLPSTDQRYCPSGAPWLSGLSSSTPDPPSPWYPQRPCCPLTHCASSFPYPDPLVPPVSSPLSCTPPEQPQRLPQHTLPRLSCLSPVSPASCSSPLLPQGPSMPPDPSGSPRIPRPPANAGLPSTPIGMGGPISPAAPQHLQCPRTPSATCHPQPPPTTITSFPQPPVPPALRPHAPMPGSPLMPAGSPGTVCPCSLGTWVRAQGDTYQVVADVSQFEPPDIVVTTSNCHVSIQAEKVAEDGTVCDTFTHKCQLPEDMDPLSVSCALTEAGTLVITARRHAGARPGEPPQMLYRSEATL